MFAGVYGVFEMERAIAGRAGDDNDIAGVDCFAVGIEADELALFRNIDFGSGLAVVAAFSDSSR